MFLQRECRRHIRGRIQRTLLYGTSTVANLPSVQAKGYIQEIGGNDVDREGYEQCTLEQAVRSMS